MKDLKIFIQARVYSSRLPGKIFFNFFEESVIERIIRITKMISDNKNIYLLTGSKKDNLVLKKITKRHKINFFCGDEKNVLKRYCDLIFSKKLVNANILRITSDNYLIQPKILKKMIKSFYKGEFQYSYIKPLSHFSGEIVSAKLLVLNYKNLPSEKSKEHVTWAIRSNPKIKKKIHSSNFCNLNHSKKICLDTISDLVFLKKIESLYPKLKNLNCINEIKKIQKKYKK